jgi:hypothetical protein
MLDGHATRRKHQEANHCSALRLKIAWRVEAKQQRKKKEKNIPCHGEGSAAGPLLAARAFCALRC